MNPKFLFFLLLLIVSSVSAMGLSVSPAELQTSYYDGFSETFEFNIVNNVGHDTYIIPTVRSDGELYKFIEPEIKEPILLKEGTAISIKFKVKIPVEPEVAGNLQGWVGAVESGASSTGGGAGVSAVTGIFSRIRVFVPFPGKYIEVTLNPVPAKVNETAFFHIDVKNKGKEQISQLTGVLTILRKGQIKQTLNMDPILNLQPASASTQTQSWKTEENDAGPYLAVLNLDYDGLKKNRTSPFNIGEFDVEIQNFTGRVPKGKISKFEIILKSNWNDPIDNVYATGNVTNKETNIVFTTPSITLQPWQPQILEGFLDATTLDEKSYPIEITIHFAKRDKKAQGQLELFVEEKPQVIKEEKKTDDKVYLYALGIIGLIVLLSINLFIMLGKRNDKEKKL